MVVSKSFTEILTLCSLPLQPMSKSNICTMCSLGALSPVSVVKFFQLLHGLIQHHTHPQKNIGCQGVHQSKSKGRMKELLELFVKSSFSTWFGSKLGMDFQFPAQLYDYSLNSSEHFHILCMHWHPASRTSSIIKQKKIMISGSKW